MKILAIVKNVLKISSTTILLVVNLMSLIYICISPYPSSTINSQLYNTNKKPCKTLVPPQSIESNAIEDQAKHIMPYSVLVLPNFSIYMRND